MLGQRTYVRKGSSPKFLATFLFSSKDQILFPSSALLFKTSNSFSMYHHRHFILLLAFCLILPCLSSSASFVDSRCRKVVDECESSPHLSRCMLSQGCHRAKNGNFIVNDEYYEAQRNCFHLLNKCLDVLWQPMKNDGYNCTDAVLKHMGR